MIHIRPASAGDEARLAYIQTESWKAAFQSIVPEDLLAKATDPEHATAMYRRLLASGKGHGYVLELDGKPHCIAWWDAARDADMAGFAELICIHSLQENWHRGYGSMMMARVLADAKAAGYRNILLWVFDRNLPAIRFYRSHGFTPTGRKQPAFGAVEEMYVKTLDAQAAQADL